jgi:beta-N-acetylhexosaminidase
VALAAGCDLVLLCNQSIEGGAAVDALLDGLEQGIQRGDWSPSAQSEARRLALLPTQPPLAWTDLMVEPRYQQALERLP